jgi:hypothetical protein
MRLCRLLVHLTLFTTGLQRTMRLTNVLFKTSATNCAFVRPTAIGSSI